MTAVSVLVPWRPGCQWRQRAWEWAQGRYPADWEVLTGVSPDGPFNRSAAILEAAQRATGDILYVVDADVWVEPHQAVQEAQEAGWAIPHDLVHRLSPASSYLVITDGHLADFDWRVLPLSEDNPQDSRPYHGHATGTAVAVRRDVLFDVPPDVRFVGWGQEDDAWAAALSTLVGPAWRGDEDLLHLWHPAQPRQDRIVGSPEGLALFQRYRRAMGFTESMRRLVDESKVAA